MKNKEELNKSLIIILAMVIGIASIGYQDARIKIVEIADLSIPRHSKRATESHSEPQKQPESAISGTIREVTAYNAGDPNQTDSTPCTSANGENICLALEMGYKRCAANFVPLGTDLHIKHFGQCKVTDRMNSRFKNRVDIAMTLEEKERAIKFGLQNLEVTIIN